LAPAAAFEIIRARRGTMYDPILVDAFQEIYLTLETEADANRPAWTAVETPATPVLAADARPAVHRDDRDLVRAAFELGVAVTVSPREHIGPTLWENLQRLGIADSLAIYRTGQGLDRLTAVYAAGAGADVASRMDIEVGDRLSGWVAANGGPMVNADPALDFEGAAPDLRSALVVRETRGDTTVVIALYSRAEQAFDDRIVALITTIAPATAARVA
jgi:hypothetical protein